MEASSITQAVVSTGYYTGYYIRQLNRADNTDKSSETASPSSEHAGLDPVTLSREGQELSSRAGSSQPNRDAEAQENEAAVQLDQEEIRQLQQLKRRDTEVRTHEQAHLSAAGRYARGGASYTLQKGPDGVSYAIGGEVGIDVGKESTPEATLIKMQTIRRAALAPANPSAADRRIAAQASVKEAQARQELLIKMQEELLQADSVGQPGSSDSKRPSLASSGEKSEPSSSSAVLNSAIAAYRKVAIS